MNVCEMTYFRDSVWDELRPCAAPVAGNHSRYIRRPCELQGYLAHKKQPTSLGPPLGPARKRKCVRLVNYVIVCEIHKCVRDDSIS